MLTDLELRALKPTGSIYKVADQRGLYVAVTSSGVVSFRFDYRLNGRRETLVIGRYDPGYLPAERVMPRNCLCIRRMYQYLLGQRT